MRRFHQYARRVLLPACACLSGLLLLTGCGSSGEDARQAGHSGPPIAVVVATVQQKTVPIEAELTARADANDSVEIRARVKAFLKTQEYREGTMVKKGQLLFTLDSREYEAQLMQARAQMARAEADLAQARERTTVETARANLEISLAQLNKADQDVNRLQPLAEQQAVPQQDFDNALAAQKAYRADVDGKRAALNTARVNQTATVLECEAAVESAKASLWQAQLNIDFCQITSPIDGIAGVRLVAPGNLVGQGDATLLTTVSNVNPMRVFASISESDYLWLMRTRREGKLRTGTGEMDLILSDGSVFPHKGQLVIFDRAVDLKTGTLSMIAQFPNPQALLRPGQFGRVRLVAAVAENVVVVPQKAVTEMQSAKIVYVVGPENKLQLRSVTLGARAGQDYIVTEGLRAGERVVVEGLTKARPGASVIPAEQPVTSEPAGGGGGN